MPTPRRGRDLRALLPEQAVPWVPEPFYVECGVVLRRWDLNRVLAEADIARAVDELLAWPLRVAAVRPLLREAWRRRANVSVPDAAHVVLSQTLGAPLLTDDTSWPTHRSSASRCCGFRRQDRSPS